MTSRRMLIVIAVLMVVIIVLDVTGLVVGAGRSTLPFLLLLGAALLLWRAVSPRTAATTETALAVPVDDAQSASLDVKFGAGVFRLAAGAGDVFLGGQCVGTVKQQVDRAADQTTIILRQPMSLVRRRADWQLVLATGIPWQQIRLMLGASEAMLDLRDLRVADLLLETGGTTLDAHLPERGQVALQISGGEATLHVPADVPVAIASEIRLGEVQVDTGLITEEDGARWVTPGYVDGMDALHIDLKGGLGKVRVVVG